MAILWNQMQILSRFFGVGIVMSERFCALLPPDLSQTCRRLDVVSTSQRIRLGASPRPRRPLARSLIQQRLKSVLTVAVRVAPPSVRH